MLNRQDLPSQSSGQASNHVYTYIKIIRVLSLTIVTAFILTLLGVSIYSFRQQANWRASLETNILFPVEGKNVTISNVKTLWRQKNSTSESVDFSCYPSAIVTIDKTSQSGKIMCYFRDGKENLKGETTTHEFNNGVFVFDNIASVECEETFENKSDFNAYFSNLTPPWSLVILEGDTTSQALTDFEELAVIPIKTTFE